MNAHRFFSPEKVHPKKCTRSENPKKIARYCTSAAGFTHDTEISSRPGYIPNSAGGVSL